jgi:hypothetical protein
VRTVMKAVLLSPVLVLVVWSVAAISFSHKQMNVATTPQRRNQQKKGWFGGSRRAQQGVLGTEQLLYSQPLQPQQQFLPQGAPLIVQPASLPKQGTSGVVSLPAQGTGATQYYTFPEQGSSKRGTVVARPAQGTGATQYYTFPEQGSSERRMVALPAQGTGATQYYTFPEQGSSERGVVALPAQGTGATQYYTFPEQGASAQQQQDYSGAENAPLTLPLAQQDSANVYDSKGVRPIPVQGIPEHAVPLPEQGTQYYNSFPEVAPGGAQGLIPLLGQGSATAQYYSLPEPGAAGNIVPLPEQGTEYQYTFPEQGAVATKPRVGTAYSEKMLNGQKPLSQGQTAVAQSQPVRAIAQPVMGGPQPNKNHLRRKQQNNKQQNNVRYYFYDPRATVKDTHGFLHLPQVVYDTFGRAVSLNSLSASAPVYLQPPPADTMNHYNISENATIYNYTHTHPPVVESRQNRRSLSMPKLNDGWGESTAADSSLIVCTVGVMALLVGALSARRLRSRSILSSCIENESLEDDAAYDTAYTTSASNHYNTFQQGWKGDLEKFDV